MAQNGDRLDIQVYLIDRTKYDFFVDDSQEIARIIGMIQPNRVFGGQNPVMLAGTYFMGGFSADAVTRIDLISDIIPSWPHPGGIKEVVEVEEEVLRRKALPRQSDPRRSDISNRPGDMVDVFAEFGLTDGRHICVRMNLEVHGAIDQRSRAYHMFSGPGFHINRRGGGVILVNPRHLIRWTVYPGPAQTPATAWKAHRLDPREWGEAPSRMFEKMDLSEEEE